MKGLVAWTEEVELRVKTESQWQTAGGVCEGGASVLDRISKESQRFNGFLLKLAEKYSFGNVLI